MAKLKIIAQDGTEFNVVDDKFTAELIYIGGCYYYAIRVTPDKDTPLFDADGDDWFITTPEFVGVYSDPREAATVYGEFHKAAHDAFVSKCDGTFTFPPDDEFTLLEAIQDMYNQEKGAE